VKLGLLSDIHGDADALERAWSHLIALGAERVVAAGDLVGYGPFPDRVAAFVAEHGIDSVRGNHDRWALERGPGVADPFGGGTPAGETLQLLGTLPFSRLVADMTRIAVIVHGSPRSDMEFVSPESHPPEALRGYLATLNADVLVFGHTHVPGWYRCGRGLAVNPGSVVCAPVVTTSRTFALLDLAALSVTFHEVQTGAVVDVAPWPADPAR
jgi:putative phosphoesterase